MKFKDGEDRTWHFRVDVLAVRRVKEHCEIDLLDLADPRSDTFTRIGQDVLLLADVMVTLLEPQLEEADVTAEDFFSALDSEELVEAAAKACMEAVINFSRKPRAAVMTKAFGKVWSKARKEQNVAIEQLDAFVESDQFDELLASKTPGSSSSDSPPAPESNPGPSA